MKLLQSIENLIEELDKSKIYLIEINKSNINWDRLKELGYTNNIYEAGYITPDGKLFDFSAKKEDGEPNMRNLDHREVGGYDAMMELILKGYIRTSVFPNGTVTLHIGKSPTNKQYNIIYKSVEIMKSANSTMDIDLIKNKNDKPLSLNYDKKISPIIVINNIKEYYR